MATGSEFFAQHLENQEKCKALQFLTQETLQNWERTSVSPHSPGPVADNETLYRLLFNPTHFDFENNSIKPTALDDASNKGLSVNRAIYSDLAHTVAQGETRAAADKVKGRDRTLVGVAEILCGTVRSIKGAEDRRAFCVFDTALQDELSHADICQVIGGKAEGRSLRSKLLEAFNLAHMVER